MLEVINVPFNFKNQNYLFFNEILETPLTKVKIKKVLIIRFSSIGDIVLTLPVVRYVKQQLKCEIHFLTKKSFESLIISNPQLDKIYSINKKVSEVLPQLKLEKYDAIIDLHKNLRTLRIRWALRIPYYSFDKLNFEKWLMVNFKINRLPKIPIVERYLEALRPLILELGSNRVEAEISGLIKEEYEDDFNGLLNPKNKLADLEIKFPELKNFFLLFGNNWIVFAIGGAHATKRLPLLKLISICSKIKTPIILIGGKEDATIGEEIVLSINDNRVVDMCGKTTLQESIQLVNSAKKIITHDTGMMHIAASLKKEIISIWGNTIPEFGMAPFYDDGIDRNTILQVENLSCRPCSKIGFEKCPKGHFRCMLEIDEDKVVGLVDF